VPDWLVKLLNRVNDWDLTWVGFRSFRPAPDQDMPAGVVLAFCVLYGPLSAVASFIISWLTLYLLYGRGAATLLPWAIGASGGVIALLLQSMLAYAWNRRAAGLRVAGKPRPPGT
jgi:hypothetical protein